MEKIEEDVTNRINAGWLKCQNVSTLLCDRRIPTKLKGKYYRSGIRPASHALGIRVLGSYETTYSKK